MFLKLGQPQNPHSSQYHIPSPILDETLAKPLVFPHVFPGPNDSRFWMSHHFRKGLGGATASREAASANGDTQSYAAGYLEGALTHTRQIGVEIGADRSWLLLWCHSENQRRPKKRSKPRSGSFPPNNWRPTTLGDPDISAQDHAALAEHVPWQEIPKELDELDGDGSKLTTVIYNIVIFIFFFS